MSDQAKHPAESIKPSPALFDAVKQAFIEQGTSFQKFCDQNKEYPGSVRTALLGISRTSEAKRRIKKVFRALRAGVTAASPEPEPYLKGEYPPRPTSYAHGNADYGLCGSCFFFERLMKSNEGFCFRFPPTPVLAPRLDPDRQGDVVSFRLTQARPGVHDLGSCGEYQHFEPRGGYGEREQ